MASLHSFLAKFVQFLKQKWYLSINHSTSYTCVENVWKQKQKNVELWNQGTPSASWILNFERKENSQRVWQQKQKCKCKTQAQGQQRDSASSDFFCSCCNHFVLQLFLGFISWTLFLKTNHFSVKNRFWNGNCSLLMWMYTKLRIFIPKSTGKDENEETLLVKTASDKFHRFCRSCFLLVRNDTGYFPLNSQKNNTKFFQV